MQVANSMQVHSTSLVCCSCLFIYWLAISFPNLQLIVRKGGLCFCRLWCKQKQRTVSKRDEPYGVFPTYYLKISWVLSLSLFYLTVVDILHLYSVICSKYRDNVKIFLKAYGNWINDRYIFVAAGQQSNRC